MGRWFEPPRRLLLALGAVAVASGMALGWLGWELLRQDKVVEAQRQQERVEHQADRVVQSLERLLAVTEDRLADWVSRPLAPVPDPVHGGVVVVFTQTAVQPSASSRLLFYPSVHHRTEPPPDLFAEGEAAEFQRRDYDHAAKLYRHLAQSPDAAVRAAALMRLGRTLRSSNRASASTAAYENMAALGDVQVIGLPAELVARAAKMQALHEHGKHDAARQEAQRLGQDLMKGRWRLTRAQFEHYADAATTGSGAGAVTSSSPEDLAIARAVGDLWLAWKAGVPTGGRRSIRVGEIPLVAAWRSGSDKAAVWIGRPDDVLQRVSGDRHSAIALSDAEGGRVAGVLDGPGRRAVRTPPDTRLPWTVHARAAADVDEGARLTRGRLLVLGLAVMLTFLIAGTYFIGRAVKQELDLARLQSDFVSTVSHEFRTPLAAMRQLSELLTAGRVPSRERRQQYYESLAGESRRLQHLVENLLSFGRLQAGTTPYRLEPIDPVVLVSTVVSEYRSQLSQPECRIEVRGADESIRMMADRDAVALALHNLIDNAVKYSGRAHTVSVNCARQGDRVALEVRDEGPGIAADEQTRIFQRFVRGTAAAAANVRGTGIGLAMVQQVVAGHGGEVTVASTPGKGSTFTMLLPAAPAQAAHTPAHQKSERPSDVNLKSAV